MKALITFLFLFSSLDLWAQNLSPIKIANQYLGTKFREDGAQNIRGKYTTFTTPTHLYSTPGYNCSGFVLAAARRILKKHITISGAKFDRRSDSGINSPFGHDWDFGLDLILNIAEDRRPRFILPISPPHLQKKVERDKSHVIRGFPLNDQSSWQDIFLRIKKGYLYLASISRPTHRKGYQFLHYHVALLLRDKNSKVWFYHTTRKNNTHRLEINSAHGMKRLQRQFFSEKGSLPKKIVIVEATIPK